jgi:hypothetical protein
MRSKPAFEARAESLWMMIFLELKFGFPRWNPRSKATISILQWRAGIRDLKGEIQKLSWNFGLLDPRWEGEQHWRPCKNGSHQTDLIALLYARVP